MAKKAKPPSPRYKPTFRHGDPEVVDYIPLNSRRATIPGTNLASSPLYPGMLFPQSGMPGSSHSPGISYLSSYGDFPAPLPAKPAPEPPHAGYLGKELRDLIGCGETLFSKMWKQAGLKPRKNRAHRYTTAETAKILKAFVAHAGDADHKRNAETLLAKEAARKPRK